MNIIDILKVKNLNQNNLETNNDRKCNQFESNIQDLAHIYLDSARLRLEVAEKLSNIQDEIDAIRKNSIDDATKAIKQFEDFKNKYFSFKEELLNEKYHHIASKFEDIKVENDKAEQKSKYLNKKTEVITFISKKSIEIEINQIQYFKN
jgi:hypothetical protein